MNTRELSAQAVLAAGRLRAERQIGPAEAVCPYDLATACKIKVSFIEAPSLEGMYSPEPRPAIVVNRLRPAGRRRFTCAHELGHHIFGHGFRIDELGEENSSPTSPEEFLAQRFASALLMTKIAVDSAFARRAWLPATAEAEQFFVVAQELGVGFTTLVTNVEVNLKSISAARADALRRIPLPKIRGKIVGHSIGADVFPVDGQWMRSTVDVEIKDLVILPEKAEFSGTCASTVPGAPYTLIATSVGKGIIKLQSGRQLSLRVSDEKFVGLARYRHLEDIDDEKL